MHKITTIIAAVALVAPAVLPAAATDDAKKAHDFGKIFEGKLLDENGKPVPGRIIGKAPYKMLYFSTLLNPRCRAVTPSIIKYVRSNRSNENFEIILISGDSSQEEMVKHLKKMKMPWAGALAKGEAFDGVTAGAGMPCIRVFDKEGKMVLDSYDEKGKYRGCGIVLEEFNKLRRDAQK